MGSGSLWTCQPSLAAVCTQLKLLTVQQFVKNLQFSVSKRLSASLQPLFSAGFSYSEL